MWLGGTRRHLQMGGQSRQENFLCDRMENPLWLNKMSLRDRAALAIPAGGTCRLSEASAPAAVCCPVCGSLRFLSKCNVCAPYRSASDDQKLMGQRKRDIIPVATHPGNTKVKNCIRSTDVDQRRARAAPTRRVQAMCAPCARSTRMSWSIFHFSFARRGYSLRMNFQ